MKKLSIPGKIALPFVIIPFLVLILLVGILAVIIFLIRLVFAYSGISDATLFLFSKVQTEIKRKKFRNELNKSEREINERNQKRS